MFWWGVCLLVLAALLTGWASIKGATTATPGDLQTVEGTLIEYARGTTSRQHGARLGKRHRGSSRPANLLRIQKPDGALAEFSSRDWITPPKLGWHKGQPIRVKHDSRGMLYEVVVGNETLRNVATTMQQREAERGDIDRIAAFSLAIGAALTLAGYFGSRQRKGGPPLLPRT